MTATDTYLLLRAFCDELARCGLRACLHLAGVALTRRSCSRSCASRGSAAGRTSTSAAPGSSPSARPRPRAAGGGHLHLRHRRGEPRSGRDRGLPGPRAADRADRRPAARAARGRRRPDDRPDQALRRRGQVVLRGRRPRGDARAPALDPRRSPAGPTGRRSTGRPGPVHLNFPLREPLVLDAPLPDDPAAAAATARPWVTRRAPPVPPRPPTVRALPARGVSSPARDERGRAEQAWPRFATAAGYPAARRPAVAAPAAARPRSPTTTCCSAIRDSRPLQRPNCRDPRRRPADVQAAAQRGWPASTGADSSRSTPRAPGRTRTGRRPPRAPRRRAAPLEAWPAPRDRRRPGLARAWRAADAAAAAAIERALGEELSEPLVARRLGEWLPPRRRCSSPPRCRSATSSCSSPARDEPPRVLSNRGANGIDGTVSSAFGVAAAATARSCC